MTEENGSTTGRKSGKPQKRPGSGVKSEAGAPSVGDATGSGQPLSQSKADNNHAKKNNDAPRHKRGPKKNTPENSFWDPASFVVEPQAGKTRFHDLDLPAELMHAIHDLEFEFCTPIQAEALPQAIAGRDVVAKASTGTGKSAVFLIASFARLLQKEQGRRRPGRPQVLVIAPTRELVVQLAKDARALGKYTELEVVAAYGGIDYQKQRQRLQEKRVDILAATPGRLLDYVGKGVVNLSEVSIMVIDEADRMLDMGFIPDVRKIIYKTPDKSKRQTVLFSATLTEDVKRLSSQWCREPVSIETESDQMTVETVEQIVYMTTTTEKYDVLYNLLQSGDCDRVMIFTNMKNEARRLSERLRRNAIDCVLLSGDVPQQKRSSRLESFREGRVKILVATDVAGRGIHINGISHVVNYTLPYEPEDYVHRIGRTGRAGKPGISISFADESGGFYLPDIEEFIGESLPCAVPPEELLVPAPKGTVQIKSEKFIDSGKSKKGMKGGRRPRR
ncbi:MAG: DEAD/DEAH box helicase [Desulfobulbaceae bacterium]|uniref:DEAD/DEAH box helicase n=1 Tax=Candidatus Desulfatifera sulfidica TaxID=2841691 RepID=A0A8J6NBE8_9BACT|nr:DEAD/DEAH box helicase [Candidatus Desulfatifera sulfidica]